MPSVRVVGGGMCGLSTAMLLGHRSVVVDGRPVATGVAPIADAWACTNPSVGRGATMGLVHAAELLELIGASA